MRVIHGIWAHGALCLWAEDQALPPHGPEPAEPRAARPSRAPGPHPFTCQAAELADLLAGLPGAAGEAARKAVDDELTLQLPSAAGGPRPSATGHRGGGRRVRRPVVPGAGWRRCAARA